MEEVIANDSADDEGDDVEDHFFAGNGGSNAKNPFGGDNDEEEGKGVYLKEEMLKKVQEMQDAFKRRLSV